MSLVLLIYFYFWGCTSLYIWIKIRYYTLTFPLSDIAGIPGPWLSLDQTLIEWLIK